MGSVYLARDDKLGRRVAIKFLTSQTRTRAERFLAEARATARCNHDNIVVIHDVDEHGDSPFMVLEYLKGQTLRELMRKDAMSSRRAVQLMVPVVRALVCAHEHQIIHRDLKPENIFITNTGSIKVLDFGIAKSILEPSASLAQAAGTPPPTTSTTDIILAQVDMTLDGAVLGTMPYMSPEQWSGDTVDARSDIWAVGIMLYEMVVGKHPLAPLQGRQMMVTAIQEQPMPLARASGAAIAPALADIIDRCLKKDRSKRFATADELLVALRALISESEGHKPDADERPYAGLNAFQEADAGRFYGRSRDIAAFITRLQDEPLMGVVGPSGVGKSSFVRAGVIPALKDADRSLHRSLKSGAERAWESLVIRPGRQPLAALARLIANVLSSDSGAVPPDDDVLQRDNDITHRLVKEPGYLGAVLREHARKHRRKLLVFIDQFEELYTLTADKAQRLAFTNALVGVADDATSPLRVVLSIRSDFLDRVAEDRELMAELDKALYFLVQPDRAGLRQAIVCPAEMVGYRFETANMVEQMLDSLESTSGALPLLQFAASKLWDGRDPQQRLLTESSYRELGGIEGALASHADAVVAGLTPQEQSLVRAIFLQLVTPERTRAIISVRELRELWQEPDTVQRLVDGLVDARLLVTNTDDRQTTSSVEIVHESLIHRWPMLDHWLDEHQDDAQFLDQLKTAAKQWHERGRPSGLLWRGTAAKEAQIWSARYRGLLPSLQRQYLKSVIALSARSARRRRMALASTIVFLSLLVIAATVALVFIRNAEQTIQEQYNTLQAEIQAKQQAQEQATTFKQKAAAASGEVELSRGQLQQKNHELEQAVQGLNSAVVQAREAETRALAAQRQAMAESTKAKKAETAARDARKAAEAANARLDTLLRDKERKLADAEKRLRQLEQRVGQIHDDL